MTRLLLPFALAATCAACASILDFQEPTDKISVASVSDDAGLAPSSASTPTSPTSSVDRAPLDAASTTSTNDDQVVEAGADAAAPDVALAAEVCACPPATSGDWQGPFVVATSRNGDAPTCTGAYPSEIYLGYSDLDAAAAECTCACGAPANVACSTPTATFFSDAACSSTCQSVTSLSCAAVSSYTCNLLGLAKPKAMTVSASAPSGGSCLPQATSAVPAKRWSAAVRLCGGDASVACGDGGCPATPSAGFSTTNRCVMKTGSATCPAEYPIKQELHKAGSDTRACTECSCGEPANVACNATLSTFNGASCNGNSVDLPAPTNCVAVSSGHVTVSSAVPSGGACLAVGGEPTGGFVTDAPTTVCCLE